LIATPRRKAKTRETMLAYIGLTSAEATLVDPNLDEEPTEPNCRVTVVPGRVLVTPTRHAARHGLEPQEYAWPAVALLPVPGRFGDAVTPMLIDISGRRATLYVQMSSADLRWSLSECGFRVVEAPFHGEGLQTAPLRPVWVPEDLVPLLPVSAFCD
jgi:hypothetical protein